MSITILHGVVTHLGGPAHVVPDEVLDKLATSVLVHGPYGIVFAPAIVDAPAPLGRHVALLMLVEGEPDRSFSLVLGQSTSSGVLGKLIMAMKMAGKLGALIDAHPEDVNDPARCTPLRNPREVRLACDFGDEETDTDAGT